MGFRPKPKTIEQRLAALLDEMQNSAKFAQDQEDKIAELKKQNEDLTEALYFYCHHAANYTDHDEQYVFFDQDQGRVACAALKKYKEGQNDNYN